MNNETLKLSEFVANIKYDKLPPEAVKEVKRRIADMVSIAIYASKEVAGTNIGKYAAKSSPPGKASIWSSGLKAAPAYAVMANSGSVFHMELDDVHRLSHTHPAATSIPPALAMAEVSGASGKTVIEAIIAGFETVIRIGLGVSPSIFTSRALMPCAQLGPMGTAAATGKIMGFSTDLMAGAIGAASFITPLTPVESYSKGATIKEFSMGWAGFLGVMAADMAQNGFVGSPYALETNFGYCINAADEYDVSRITKDMGGVYEILNTGIKPYAHCRQHHSTIDAILDVRKEQKLDVEYPNIKSILVRTFLPAARGVNKTFPTLSAAKYSVPYAVAISMVFGDAWIGQYVEENLTDKRLLDIASKVEVLHDLELQKLYDDKWPAIVEIEMNDGKKINTRRDLMKGEPEYPLSDDDMHKKFTSLATRVYDEAKVQRIWDKIFDIDKSDNITDLMSEFA